MSEPPSLVVVGDYVARDKYAISGSFASASLAEVIDLVPRVPHGYRGPIPVLSVYEDLPTDTYLFHFSTPAGPGCAATRPAPPYPDDLLPIAASIHEILTNLSEPMVLVGPSGSGKTTALYRLAHDLLAQGDGIVSLLDGNGSFGAHVARIMAEQAPLGAADLRGIVGVPYDLRRGAKSTLAALLVDHVYLMSEDLADASAKIVERIMDRYGPAKVIMTELSPVAAQARATRLNARIVELTPLPSDYVERLLINYQPYITNTAPKRAPAADAATPGEALEAMDSGHEYFTQILRQLRAGLAPAYHHCQSLDRVPDLFYAALAKHPAPLTQADMINVLCAGDVFDRAAEAVLVATRLISLGLFVPGRDGTATVYISDLALAQRIAAVSNGPLSTDIRGALIDVASRRIQVESDRDARLAIKTILTLPRLKAAALSDIDDLQRRARLANAYLRAGRNVDGQIVSRIRRLAGRLIAIGRSDQYPLRLRESILRDSVELYSWIGPVQSTIDFFWVPPGEAKFRLPRASADELCVISEGFYLSMRPLTESQLYSLREALRIGAKYPSRRTLTDPASKVTWIEARDLVLALTSHLKQAGVSAFLPSVPEWALAREYSGSKSSVPGNVVDTATCLGHRCPVDLYSPPHVPYFGGGLLEWTRSAWGSEDLDDPKYRSPYSPHDGREGLDDRGMRLLRGSSWLFRENEILCSCVLPVQASFPDVGIRLALRPTSASLGPRSELYLDVTRSPMVMEEMPCA